MRPIFNTIFNTCSANEQPRFSEILNIILQSGFKGALCLAALSICDEWRPTNWTTQSLRFSKSYVCYREKRMKCGIFHEKRTKFRIAIQNLADGGDLWSVGGAAAGHRARRKARGTSVLPTCVAAKMHFSLRKCIFSLRKCF